jgi:uncharacterized protein (DUF1684 family)
MKNMIAALLCMLFLSAPAIAGGGEQKQVFGDYEVHYMGLTTTFLTPDVARAYQIERSRSLGFLNIAVIKRTTHQDVGEPVPAVVTGDIKNLIGQSNALQFKEIRETSAVYYVTTLPFDEDEVYRISLKVKPEGSSQTYDVNFSQRFYEE